MDLSRLGMKSGANIEKEQLALNFAEKHHKWTGKVVKIDDPLMMGRIKVEIFGYYDGLAIDKMPWSIPRNSFLGSKNGNFIIPELNTVVTGYFDNQDEMKPVYEASIRTLTTNIESNTYLDRLKDYTNTQVLYENDYGDAVIVNKLTGETKIKHRSGLNISFTSTGTINITSSMPGMNYNVDVGGNATINANGNVDIIATGDASLNAGGDVNLGNNKLKQLVANLQNCIICGTPLHTGNTNVKA